MSSRLLLVLLKELPDSSAFKRDSVRGGNWPVWLQLLKHLTNEMSLNRAAKYVGSDNEYIPTLYADPIERTERAKEAAELLAELEDHKQDSVLGF